MILAVLLLSITAAVVTQELNLRYNFGAVRSSSLVSLIAGLLVYFLNLNPVYGVAVMGASFAAMSSEKVIPSRFWMFVCSLVFAVVFLNLSNDFFSGYGGKLGTTACISVVSTLGLMFLTNKFKKKKKRKKKK